MSCVTIDTVILAAQLLGTGEVQAASTRHKRSVREDQETDERDRRTEAKDQVRWLLYLHCAVYTCVNSVPPDVGVIG